MSEYAAVLLAGGRSSRMGRDKARLPHPASGLPLLARQLATLRAAGADPLLLSLRPDQDYPEAPASVLRVHDTGEKGPLGALAAAFAALSTRSPRPAHVLVLAVDMPRVSPDLLRRLVAAARPGVGVVPRNEATGNYEPLCAIYPLHPSCRHALDTALATGRLALQGFVATGVAENWMHIYPLTQSELSDFSNWNTPQDLQIGT